MFSIININHGSCLNYETCFYHRNTYVSFDISTFAIVLRALQSMILFFIHENLVFQCNTCVAFSRKPRANVHNNNYIVYIAIYSRKTTRFPRKLTFHAKLDVRRTLIILRLIKLSTGVCFSDAFEYDNSSTVVV